MTPRADAEDRGALAGGCLIALASATLTSLMLFINGSFVWALLSVVTKTGPSWASKPEFLQFTLFVVPVLLVIVEWVMIDYVRSRIPRRDQS